LHQIFPPHISEHSTKYRKYSSL